MKITNSHQIALAALVLVAMSSDQSRVNQVQFSQVSKAGIFAVQIVSDSVQQTDRWRLQTSQRGENRVFGNVDLLTKCITVQQAQRSLKSFFGVGEQDGMCHGESGKFALSLTLFVQLFQLILSQCASRVDEIAEVVRVFIGQTLQFDILANLGQEFLVIEIVELDI